MNLFHNKTCILITAVTTIGSGWEAYRQGGAYPLAIATGFIIGSICSILYRIIDISYWHEWHETERERELERQNKSYRNQRDEL